jgi:integrase/recombinase XerD
MERFFTDRLALARLQQSLFAPYLSSVAEQLQTQGYCDESIQKRIKIIFDFGRWLRQCGRSAHEVTPELLQSFYRYRRRRRADSSLVRVTLQVLLGVLQDAGAVRRGEDLRTLSSVEQLLEGYVIYLQRERGLSEHTIRYYRGVVVCFLSRLFAAREVDLSGVCGADVMDFVRWYAAAHAKRAKLMVTALRSFFRYARYRGHINSDLAASVPKVAQWSLVSIPRGLPREHIILVLSKCDRQTAAGRRDYAILLLLARLGIRAGEVKSLKLEDIDWQASRITIHGKSRADLQLPLPRDVGEAIADYLCHGRPCTNERYVFLRAYAPVKRLTGQATVSGIVARALIRAGIDSPWRGAHQFRHSLATEMLRQGASLSEIGEVLGHRSPDTTAIYAKVDLASLSALAPAWPGGKQ